MKKRVKANTALLNNPGPNPSPVRRIKNILSGRKLNKELIRRLATCECISEHRNLFITGVLQAVVKLTWPVPLAWRLVSRIATMFSRFPYARQSPPATLIT